MIRAAAKNHQDVTVVVDPADYAGERGMMNCHQKSAGCSKRVVLAGCWQ